MLFDLLIRFEKYLKNGDAQRKCAGFYNESRDKEDRLSWDKFYALWVNPKHYEQLGITFEEDKEVEKES